MKRSAKLLSLYGFALTALGGTLLHFLYEWLNEAKWIAPFAGVNESTWEHMKLFFWPALLFAFAERFFLKEREDFWCIKLRGILTGLSLIPVLFYTYNGVIGKSPDFINITIFFLSTAIAFYYETKRFEKNDLSCRNPQLALASLIVIALLFTVFTFVTPRLGIFRDPVTNSYGV